MLKGFKDFLFQGNIVDLAIAVVIGTAFTALIGVFTKSIIQPFINALGGSHATNGLGFQILSANPSTFVDLGSLLNAIITFVITAAVVYFVFVVPMSKMLAKGEATQEAPGEDVLLLREIRDSLQK